MADKWIWFDMDGTLADLYKVPDWLKKLRSNDPSPYLEAVPMVDFKELNTACTCLRRMGFKIGVISWLSMDAPQSYDTEVRRAKRAWMRKYHFNPDSVHLVKYGTPKHFTIPKAARGILWDDNAEVGQQWQKAGGKWFNPQTSDINAVMAAMAGI